MKYFLIILQISVFLLVIGCTKDDEADYLSFKIVSPDVNDVFNKTDDLIISVNVANLHGIEETVSIYIDDDLLISRNVIPYRASIKCDQLTVGGHVVKIIVDNSETIITKEIEISIIDLQEESSSVVDFLHDYSSSWYLDGWEITGTYELMSSNKEGIIVTTKTFTQSGNVHFSINNSTDSIYFYMDGDLVSGWFPVDEWTDYYFYVNEGRHTFKWKHFNQGLSLKNIVFEEGVIKHSVGEYYGGGIVTLVDSLNRHGLITYPTEIGESVWGCTNIDVVGNLSHTDGYSNTLWISKNCVGSNAAKKCKGFSTTQNDVSYGDWYLPTAKELYPAYFLKDYIGGYYDRYYWLSFSRGVSPAGYGNPGREIAGVIDFADGRFHGSSRNIKRGIIPVRKF